MKQLVVGDFLYCMGKKGIEKHIIKKKGRKYFHVSNSEVPYPEYRPDIETLLHQEPNFSQANRQFYRTEKEILDIREAASIRHLLRNYFSRIDSLNLSLMQLQRIKQIIDES